MLKVVVTGAYSTGKSSLIEVLASTLAEEGLSVARVADVARTCRLPLNEAQTDAASLWLLTTQVSREIEASLGPETVMLCDRGVPDILAHHFDLGETPDESWIASTGSFPDRWVSTYDVVLFSRVDEAIPIAADGLRSEDAAYRTSLDVSAAKVLACRSDVVILSHHPSDRLRQAREAIMWSLAGSRSSLTL